MKFRKLSRYEVTVQRTDTYEHTHYVLAYSQEQAEEVAETYVPFDTEVTAGPRIVDYDEEGEHIDGDEEVTTVTLIEPNGDHEVHPVHWHGKPQCKLCGEPVRWTGTSDPTTGACITPGPWVHVNAA